MLAVRFINWAKSHPILVGLGIVVYYMATVNQDRVMKNFVVASAVLILVVGLLVLRARQEDRSPD